MASSGISAVFSNASLGDSDLGLDCCAREAMDKRVVIDELMRSHAPRPLGQNTPYGYLLSNSLEGTFVRI